MASIFDDFFSGPGLSRPAPKPSKEDELFLAASRNNVGKLKLLLESAPSADPSFLVNGFCSLHVAAKKGYTEVASMLLACSPSLLRARTADGRTAAMLAAYEGHCSILQALEVGDPEHSFLAATDKEGNTVLHFAAWGGSLDCVEWLLRRHCDPAIKNLEGMLPLQYAAAGNHNHIVECLLSNAREAHTDDSASGMNALHRACIYGSENVVRQLLNRASTTEQGRVYHPMATTGNGSTALHLAAQHGHEQVVQLLLSMIPSSGINLQNDFGLTPLHYACIGGYREIVEGLLRQGGDPTLCNASKENALHLAAAAGRHEISRLLVQQYGCDPFLKDKEGKSSIERAVEAGFKELANSLTLEAFVTRMQSDLCAITM